MSAALTDRDVKPVTRHQTSCPDLPTTHHNMHMPAHRKSVIVNPVSTMDYSINDDFSMGPKGAQRNPVILTSSRELIILNSITNIDWIIYLEIANKLYLYLLYTVSEGIVAESLTKLMESKLVKEKKLEMEKKIEMLRRKQEKEKHRAQHMKSSHDSERMRMSKFSMSSRFVKRLSIKNM